MAPESLVSVIIPTRNRAELLKRSIASVLGQTHRNLELIVVNDFSTDHTREVLAAIGDPRLRVIHREQNHGAAAARNAGLAIARGDYVSFQDDDDYWLVQKLEKQVRALQASPDIAWCIACYIRLEPKGPMYIGGDWYIRQLDYRLGIGEDGPNWSLIATPGWLVRREVLIRVGGFDERIRSWDDWELGLRLSAVGRPVVLDEPLWVQDWLKGQGLTRATRVRANDLRIAMDKHGAVWAGNRKVQAQHWYVIGRIESLYLPAPAGRVELRRSLRLYPLRPLTWAALAMCYLGQQRTMALTQRFRSLRKAMQ